jgi:hypothetical protein
MSRKVAVLCLVAMGLWLGAIAQPASASVFTNALSFDGIPDTIQDNSVATVIDNGDGVLGVGDTVIGLLKWNDNISDGVSISPTSLAFFVADIESMNGSTYSLKASTNSTYNLATLFPSLVKDTSTIGVLFSKVNGVDLTLGNLAAAIASLETGTWSVDATFGLVESTDYFEANLPGATTAGSESGVFSVIVNNLGVSDEDILPVTAEGVTGSGDIAFYATLHNATTKQQANGWVWYDQASITVNVVPEPASMMIWSLLGMVVGCKSLRRRKQA